MSTVIADLPRNSDPTRKVWSRAEFENLPPAALHYERLELVEGELISKMGKKRPHVNALILMHAWLIQVFGFHFVHPEAPIDVAPEDNPSSEPEPDLIVTRRAISSFRVSNPTPDDLLLVVEIADTTLGFDLTAKARLYARAGIAEYWVVDVAGKRLIVHRKPEAGKYSDLVVYQEGDSVTPLASPTSTLLVGSILPG